MFKGKKNNAHHQYFLDNLELQWFYLQNKKNCDPEKNFALYINVISKTLFYIFPNELYKY